MNAVAGLRTTRLRFLERPLVPKRNYGQAKRQREMSREEKKAQKMQRKLERGDDLSPPTDDAAEPESPDTPSPS